MLSAPSLLASNLIGGQDMAWVPPTDIAPAIKMAKYGQGRDRRETVIPNQALVRAESGPHLNDFARSLMESAPVCMIVTDCTGRIVAMNLAARRLTLHDIDRMVDSVSLMFVHDTQAKIVEIVEVSQDDDCPILRESETSIAELAYLSTDEQEWTLIRKDGSQSFVNITAIPSIASDGTVTGYIHTSVDINPHKTLMDVVKRMHLSDPLTGLPNRLRLNERLAQGMKHCDQFNQKMAVFVIGLDHFKRINDSLGHANADMVLFHLGTRLEAAMRNTDMVARVGGDEFAIFMLDCGSFEDAERCANLIQQVISVPKLVGGHDVRVTASIGYCLYPDVAGSAADLLSRAELAMHEAKDIGTCSCRAFLPDMHLEANLRLTLEEELRLAIENEELELHYQPQVQLTTGNVTGMEMLLRWKHPTRGFVPPSTFIPAAENAGLLAGIGEWSLRKACKEAVLLEAELCKPLTLAVNLSPSQLCQPNLLAVIRGALQDSGLPGNHLEIEITEQVMMTAHSPVISILNALRGMGVRVAIDDFGVGYSSFSYIMQYQFDRLKVDRSFISRASTDSDAAAIVRAMISLAHDLGMEVVGEGIETPEQRDFLIGYKCDAAQGYLFSKAIPFAEFSRVATGIDSAVNLYLTDSQRTPTSLTAVFARVTEQYPDCISQGRRRDMTSTAYGQTGQMGDAIQIPAYCPGSHP